MSTNRDYDKELVLGHRFVLENNLPGRLYLEFISAKSGAYSSVLIAMFNSIYSNISQPENARFGQLWLYYYFNNCQELPEYNGLKNIVIRTMFEMRRDYTNEDIDRLIIRETKQKFQKLKIAFKKFTTMNKIFYRNSIKGKEINDILIEAAIIGGFKCCMLIYYIMKFNKNAGDDGFFHWRANMTGKWMDYIKSLGLNDCFDINETVTAQSTKHYKEGRAFFMEKLLSNTPFYNVS